MTPDEDNPDRTVFSPGSLPSQPPVEPPAPPPPPVQESAPPSPAEPASTPPSVATSFAPARTDGRIQVGDVLNHIFEVRRFIARGGMGEVFEGVNVNSDERVAIKVILPQLAADPNVQAMFRKEARTLTRLAHPALVQYRVIAQEPQLGVLYIVTEFVDGVNLADVLAQLKPSPDDLVHLLRRLAEGLRAAHALGAIHRDMSPDNVLLDGGQVAHARVIDFGIAKDLDPSSKTIVGDGFAGKLNYVAPEQLGDFDREVGPWTDVYSLALVVVAAATGKNVNMGATLVEAVDRRRAGVDLGGVAGQVKPVLEAMLRPNPADRLRSMDAVIAALDGNWVGATVPAAVAAQAERSAKAEKPAKPPKQPKPAKEPKPAQDAAAAPSKKPLMLGGAALASLLVLGGGLYVGLSGSGSSPQAAPTEAGAPAPTTPGRPPVKAVRDAVTAALPSVGCSWLDAPDVQTGPGGVSVALGGVAGTPAEAQAAISKAVDATGVHVASTDMGNVVPVPSIYCPLLDTYRQIRGSDPGSLTVAKPAGSQQAVFQMTQQTEGELAGKLAARPVTTLMPASAPLETALISIDQKGAVNPIIPDRATLDKVAADPAFGITKLPNGSFQINGSETVPGWSGILLLTGRGPFPQDVIVPPKSGPDAAWQQRFLAAARAGGWKAEMTWYKVTGGTGG